jgi:hypothetical protein
MLSPSKEQETKQMDERIKNTFNEFLIIYFKVLLKPSS